MVRQSHKRRKRFACGHLGFGQWCHRCAASKRHTQPKPPITVDWQQSKTSLSRSWTVRSQKTARQKAARQQWKQQFQYDPIPLEHLPKPIVVKTRLLLTALVQGRSPGALQGKRFNFDRTLVRIPITYRYRLLCRWQKDGITPLGVMSHEAYNAIARHKKRVNRA